MFNTHHGILQLKELISNFASFRGVRGRQINREAFCKVLVSVQGSHHPYKGEELNMKLGDTSSSSLAAPRCHFTVLGIISPPSSELTEQLGTFHAFQHCYFSPTHM